MSTARALSESLKLRFEAASQPQTLSPAFFQRYPKIPADYLNFLQSFYKLETADETSWFNSVHDFNSSNSSSEFAWNEFELQSLEALSGDAQSLTIIRDFWDAHLPVVLSVKQGYAYFAIGVADHNWGQVFYGEEPEYEEAVLVADSFANWMKALMEGSLEKKFADLLRPDPKADASEQRYNS